MLTVRGPSKWKFITSSTGGVGIEFVAAEGGMIYFKDPQGRDASFRYGAAGVGLSAGLKLPKIGQIQIKGKDIGAAIAPASFPNAGELFVLDSFSGKELTYNDITGACIFVEIGGGILAGVSATAMLVGMDPVWLAGFAIPFAPIMIAFDERLLQSAVGLLVMGGTNLGIQAGGGIGAFLGGLW